MWNHQQASGEYTPGDRICRKSNVGKSSLINALMNRKSYAENIRNTGKDTDDQLYNINEELYLVDLPGYGYAKVSNRRKSNGDS